MVVGKHVITVTNIPWTVGRHELWLYFSKFGCVTNTFVAFDKLTGLHQGYGDVTFLKKECMNAALESKHPLEGKDLVLCKRESKID
ncbi:PREDICTED: SRA stem-loop-interacting RNA-binding protein, mitochondrial-like [Trachymyrmex cornetzi]|uniref:SRA stem-loop-interacting RNA-binding protein, mitochondrial n=1 Tax=Trachymyrmex cornetzi TaxID=471704 RepID=A0A195DN53_9HYME|nr:PREDICTED: SRA stem-loop-interacting RNA-binding protein, mitochondrial-like [Trachymyrmex cornetzi]KYN14262.1 SRA stem-loop-interacting RNA-binding protein, mitochondrial [Trachymyrmex cornetzi]